MEQAPRAECQQNTTPREDRKKGPSQSSSLEPLTPTRATELHEAPRDGPTAAGASPGSLPLDTQVTDNHSPRPAAPMSRRGGGQLPPPVTLTATGRPATPLPPLADGEHHCPCPSPGWSTRPAQNCTTIGGMAPHHPSRANLLRPGPLAPLRLRQAWHTMLCDIQRRLAGRWTWPWRPKPPATS